MSNPLANLREECQRLLEESITEAYTDIEAPKIKFSQPPAPEMGELSTPICFQLARIMGQKPHDIAEKVSSLISTKPLSLIRSVETVKGYLNFHADVENFARLVLETSSGNERYGFLKTDLTERVMVEHTSANPNGPVHIGNARNSILGDALAEMLRQYGHSVETHFYVNDMGRQVAMATYGWRMIGRPEPEGRPDMWVGMIYASVNVLKELKRLKRELIHSSSAGDIEEISRINRELSSFAAAAQDLRERNPVVFDELLDKMEGDPDPEASITKLNTDYENASQETKDEVRRLVGHCLHGFKEALGDIRISFDSWDFESDFVWSGAVDEVVEALRQTPYTLFDEGALVLDCDAIARDMGLKERWGINPDYEVPPLVLIRADGTTLYTVRDIAYSIWKFERVERVINVIGYEQSLAQLQLKIALAAMGKTDIADRQTHFAYEFVRLPEVKMSGRLGKYVTLREVIERSVSLALDEVTKRSPQLKESQRREIAETVGHGAVKYVLLSVDPMKVVIFDWEKALNFDINSGPFIQYSHARACNILNRVKVQPGADYGLLTDRRERDLVMTIALFPEVFENAAKELKPADILAYANMLADKFNRFYAVLPVLKAEPRGLCGARLMLVESVRIVLKNALSLLGIEAPHRM